MTPNANNEQNLSERDRLVLQHLPLVRAIAIRVHENLPVHVDLDDLVHAGIIGLFEAADQVRAVRENQSLSAVMQNIASRAQFSTVCAIWFGLRAICASGTSNSKPSHASWPRSSCAAKSTGNRDRRRDGNGFGAVAPGCN